MMKKTIEVILLVLTTTLYVNAQSTERFIRIIGNSKKEIKATKAKVYFSISELKENKYQKTESRPYDEVYNEFISKITAIGLKEADINKSYKKLSNYGKIKMNKFFVEGDLKTIEKFTSIKVDGFRMSSIKYLMPTINNNLETELSLMAIEDAKRKAKVICNSIDMKLGKILNIEVKSNDLGSSNKESKDILTIKTYKVSITFKLID